MTARYAQKRDTSEPECRRVVVDEFYGSWQSLDLRDGPDAVVGVAGITELWEIKTGNAKLKPGQEAWHRAWRGRPVQVIRNQAQARKRCRMLVEAAENTRIVFPVEPVNGWDAAEKAEEVPPIAGKDLGAGGA